MNILSSLSSTTLDPAKLWAARVEFLAAQPSTLAVTLDYNDWPISQHHIRHDLRGLHTLVDWTLLGTRFDQKPAAARTRFFGFIEGTDHHPHVHMGW